MPAQTLFWRKKYCQDLVKMHSENVILKRSGHSHFCICIWSVPFRCNIYGRRVFLRITQHDLLRFAAVHLLVFAPLFRLFLLHSWSALPCLVNLALEIISIHQIVGCYDAFISFSFFILTAGFSHCLLSLYCNFFVLSSFDV